MSTGMWDIALRVCMFRRFMAVAVRVSCALPGVEYAVWRLFVSCLNVMTGKVDT